MADEEKDLKTDQMVLNIGPSHPATHGTVRIIATLEGETVVHAEVEIGYLHRAFEKSCERGTWQQVFPYTDRLNYNSAIINNVAYAMAVEKLLGIEVPERCQFIRCIASELSRIADHLTCIGPSAMELGAVSAFLYFVEAREFIWDLIELLCGARLTNNYVHIGGIKADLPTGFAEKARQNFVKTSKLIEEVDKLLTHNRIFIDRMRGTGVISPGDALDWGWTGPCLRSTGVPLDLRKDEPYMVYDRVDFDVPVGEFGDNFDRYLVRMEEMRQSFRIIEQLFETIPEGPINIDDTRVRWPAKQLVHTKMEELINHFKIVFEGVSPPKGEAYAAVEGPNGELGFYLVSDGTGKPVKVRCRPPSFAAIQPLGTMLGGAMLSDIVPSFGMLNMVGGECDR